MVYLHLLSQSEVSIDKGVAIDIKLHATGGTVCDQISARLCRECTVGHNFPVRSHVILNLNLVPPKKSRT